MSNKYLEWKQKKLKGIVDYYGHNFFVSKKVLDLGCGHSDIGGALHRLGADITAVDARQENLKIASKKFPGIKTVRADLDFDWSFRKDSFDIILDIDLLCHLANYENHLRAVCSNTSYLVLETSVFDDDDPYKSDVVFENKNLFDSSFNGIGCRPTSSAIERILKECGMSFKRLDDSKFNSGNYIYNWAPQNNKESSNNKRRIWFATKDGSPVVNPIPPITINPNNNILQNSHLPVINKINKQEVYFENKNIKTALCISGHLRTFVDNFPSVKEFILNKLDCDVFIHTWDTLGLAWRHTDAHYYRIDTKILEQKIKELYNPKKLVIEPPKNFEVTTLMHKRLIDHRDIPGILSMFYKMEACNNLKSEFERENNFKYDCVIRFRGDLSMESPLPITDSKLKPYLYLPLYGNFAGLCDQIAYGNSEIMDAYSSIFSSLEKNLEDGAPMHPELMIKHHVAKNNILVSKVNINYVIKRANGLIQNNMLLERAQGFIR